MESCSNFMEGTSGGHLPQPCLQNRTHCIILFRRNQGRKEVMISQGRSSGAHNCWWSTPVPCTEGFPKLREPQGSRGSSQDPTAYETGADGTHVRSGNVQASLPYKRSPQGALGTRSTASWAE